MISSSIGRAGKLILDQIVRALSFFHINPNLLTFTGVLFSFWAALHFGHGSLRTGALIGILAGLFNTLDGEVARLSGSETRFGELYASVIDRYSDIILLQGLMVWYARQQRLGYVVLVGIAFMGAIMTSYARARAESLIPTCKVGFMERPERLVLLILAGTFDRMAPALWVIAVVSTITVIHRIVYTWQETKAGRTLPGIHLVV